jgi:pimeloyl-ACP methyl ester carboxylesterase
MPTVSVPGAQLYHEVRGTGPLVVLVAAPMDARPFTPLAELLAADHTVVTTEPRGISRSTREDPEQEVTVELRADDLAALIAHLDAGPAAVLGSSGGAVSVLALAQRHPDAVRQVIAHEPPLLDLLPDREERHARTEAMIATYESGDLLGAMVAFVEAAELDMTKEQVAAMLPGPDDAEGLRNQDVQFRHMLRATTRWVPDTAALRALGERVVVGLGEDSAGEVCDHTSRALAAALGRPPVLFPGGHIGFAEAPGPFAERLRTVIQRGLSDTVD